VNESFVTGMLDELCRESALQKFRLVFTLAIVVIALMAIWFPFVDRNSATFVVVVMNLFTSGLIALLTGSFVFGCRFRDE